MTIKIGFPDIPKRAVKITHTDPWGDAIRRQDFVNNISGPRYTVASLDVTGGKTGLSRSNYDLGETTSAVDHLVIGRADLLKADDIKSVRLRGSRQSAFLPSSISGLKLWLDANRGVTTVSGAVSQWDDLSGNGNHATQGTAANRPYLTNYDNRENAASYNNTTSNAAWNKTVYPVSSVDNFTTNYLGESIAAKVTATAGTTRHGIINVTNKLRVAPGEQYVFAVDVKKSNFRYVWVGDQSDSPWHGINFDLDTGLYIGNGDQVTSKTSQSLGSGWYRLTLIFTSVDGHLPGCGVWFGSAVDNTSPPSIAAVGTEEFYICRAQIRRASTDDFYINTPADAILAGINSNRSIMFDGSNDALPTSYAPLINSGFSIFAYIKPNVVNTNQSILSCWLNTASARIQLIIQSTRRMECYVANGSTAYIGRQSAAGGLVAGAGFVLSVTYDGTTSATGIKIYKDGTQIDTTTASLGVYTVPTTSGQVIEVGAMTAGAANRFNGLMTEALFYQAAVSATERGNIEQYLTDKWTLAPTVKTHTLSTDTLTNNDLVLEPSATSSAYRHWWLEMESDAASKFTHSKIYFGQWLDMGETVEDVRVIKGLDLNDAFTTDAGSRKLAKSKQSKYQIEITWSGLTDAKVKSFIESVAAQMLLNNSFYLYAGTNSDQLNGNSLLYCKLVEWSFPEKAKLNYNTIRATFEEID